MTKTYLPRLRKRSWRINSEASASVDSELEKFGKDGRKYEARPGRTPHETLE
ncbi:MAG: hypothetical protein Ct9H90mP26_0080 [Methanobacteriota archaeon]|nr:MAG: hypothetical protein Ct9H90mP26_0080 [Euryarchaeota archaeon]